MSFVWQGLQRGLFFCFYLPDWWFCTIRHVVAICHHGIKASRDDDDNYLFWGMTFLLLEGHYKNYYFFVFTCGSWCICLREIWCCSFRVQFWCDDFILSLTIFKSKNVCPCAHTRIRTHFYRFRYIQSMIALREIFTSGLSDLGKSNDIHTYIFCGLFY